jgi:hypothetical protein
VQETGLLEQTVLLLRPPDAAGRRLLLAESGQPVGFAHQLDQGWWSWWRPAVAVHEDEDQPLVFTVKRCFTLLPRREVIDGDGELVGVIALPWLFDRWGNLAGEVRAPHGGSGVFQANGSVLAEWGPWGDTLRLEFKPAVRKEPYVKMLLLAAILHFPLGA